MIDSKSAPLAGRQKSVKVKLAEKKERRRNQMIAQLALSPVVPSTKTACTFAKTMAGDLDFSESLEVVVETARRVQVGDLSGQEATLAAQAVALDTIFNELARRAAANMGEHLNAADMYLRLGLRAQAQCRATIETLAEIKNPRSVAFVNQANIAHGLQQVNNQAAPANSTRARETEIEQNKLSGKDNELCPDAGAQGLTGGVNQEVEAVGTIDRAAVRRR